jgi:hypothetical protein
MDGSWFFLRKFRRGGSFVTYKEDAAPPQSYQMVKERVKAACR